MRRSRPLLTIAKIADAIMLPFTLAAGLWLRALRVRGLQYMPASKWALGRIGVFPIRDHYYEPLTDFSELRYDLAAVRNLPAIDFNVEEQLSILSRFEYQKELLEFPIERRGKLEYYYRNESFESGDSEYLYSIVRLLKPKRFIEVGCGSSTLIAQSAIRRNATELSGYACEHICIEPYEQPWLEDLGIEVIRRRVEECDESLFGRLESGDVLFIDSSHVIRPQGDVLFEILEILPKVKSGVYVHIHDIFTPRDYLKEWVVDEVKLWNEQYLLEAFLSFNTGFRVIGAVNFLKHRYPEEIKARFPVLAQEFSRREPGSFWMART